MRVAEIFCSKQGEGFLTGTESVFVRLSGCNLRCWFCDTKYASWYPEGEELSVDDIVQRVLRSDLRHVVLTGGEPMIFADIVPLTEKLAQEGRHITVETSGTCYRPVKCHLMSISPKLSNSKPPPETGAWVQRHERMRYQPDVIRQLVRGYEYQFKFVVDKPDDCREVEEYLARFPEIDRRRVFLMPQGADLETLRSKAAWLQEYCREHGLLYCPRMQFEWYGGKRGT